MTLFPDSQHITIVLAQPFAARNHRGHHDQQAGHQL